MTTMLPPQSLAALATLVAALIAGAISFVNLTLTKELKTSEFRQAWIDGLREELAAFFGAAQAFARAVEAKQKHEENCGEKEFFPLTDEKISDIRHQVAETISKISLRLNPDEREHIELLRLLYSALDEQNSMIETNSSISATIAAITAANEYARPVLKKEWKRVKKGELPFRIARNYVAPLFVLVSIGFIVFIFLG